MLTKCTCFDFTCRYGKYKNLKRAICDAEGSLEQFAEGYNKFGVRRGMQDGKVRLQNF
jgi:hypothetical protein